MEASVRQSLYGFEVREHDNRRNFEGGKYNIQQLWQRSHEILALAVQGFKQADIARILGVTPTTVSNTLNSELGVKKLSKLREERDEGVVNVSKKVAEMSERALKVYEEIFENDTISYDLKKRTADTVLMDLGGHRAPTQVETKSLHTTATLEEIEEFKRRGLAAARESGMLIEVEGESSVNLSKSNRRNDPE